MSESICRFMPAKEYSGEIKTVNFVFETEFFKMKQPFFRPIYVMHLVTRGGGVLSVEGEKYKITRGSIFFAFPGRFFEIEGSRDLEYAYISFMGDGVPELFGHIGVNANAPVYNGFEHIIEFWLSSLRRLEQGSANILTEGVLLYTLSLIISNNGNTFSNGDNVFDAITDYIDRHYTDSDISLRKVSGIFSYTQKYMSFLFKKNMGIGFCAYINRLRIERSLTLMRDGISEIYAISESCGFTDPLYFSKVFKKRVGCTPSDYINMLKNENNKFKEIQK